MYETSVFAPFSRIRMRNSAILLGINYAQMV